MLRSLLVLGLINGLASAQSGPAFEVATVKPADPNARGYTIRGGPANRGGQSDPGQIEYVNHSLQQLLLAAYAIMPFELSAPSWIDGARFDVRARLPAGATVEQIPAMLRSLLAERFHLAVHHEKKEETVYNLTLAKGGAKLKESTAGDSPQLVDGVIRGDKNGFPAPVAGRIMSVSMPSGLRISAGRQDAGQIARMLSKYVTAVVNDQTGLTGKYDFTLEFAEDNPPPEAIEGHREVEPAASLFTAIQEQLGLRLEKAKGPVDMLVIDRVDRSPVEN